MLLVFLDFLFLPTDRPLVLSPVSNTWYELKMQNKNTGFILESENEGGFNLFIYSKELLENIILVINSKR